MKKRILRGLASGIAILPCATFAWYFGVIPLLVLLTIICLAACTAILITLLILDIRSTPCRVGAAAGGFLIPLLLLAGIALYHGITVCNHCGSVSLNSVPPDRGIIRIDVCHSCVCYITCGSMAHFRQDPPLPQVCLDCQGPLRTTDDRLGITIIFASVLLFTGAYFLTGLIFFLRHCVINAPKKSLDGAEAQPAGTSGR